MTARDSYTRVATTRSPLVRRTVDGTSTLDASRIAWASYLPCARLTLSLARSRSHSLSLSLCLSSRCPRSRINKFTRAFHRVMLPRDEPASLLGLRDTRVVRRVPALDSVSCSLTLRTMSTVIHVSFSRHVPRARLFFFSFRLGRSHAFRRSIYACKGHFCA